MTLIGSQCLPINVTQPSDVPPVGYRCAEILTPSPLRQLARVWSSRGPVQLCPIML